MAVRITPVVLLLLVYSLALSGVTRASGATEANAPKTAYDFYLRGNGCFRKGDYDGAVSAFGKSIELHPGYFYSHINLGVSLAKRRKFEAAISEFTLCIDEQRGSGADRFVFYFNRALAHQEGGQKDAAQQDRATLKKLDPVRAAEFTGSDDYLLMDTAYVEKRNEIARDRMFAVYETPIAEGEVVVRKVPGAGKGTEEYEAMGLIEGTLEEVSGVLADYARYPEFVPDVKEMTITNSSNGDVIVDWQLQLPLGYVKKYRLKCWAKREGDTEQRFWKKLPWPGLKPDETIVDTYGQWILEVFPGEGRWVLAYYRVYTDPGRIPFGTGWVVDVLTQRSVPNIIKRTRKRVKDLFY